MQTVPGRSTARTVTLLALVAVTVYLLDLLTKVLVVAFLTPYEPVRVIGDVVTFTLIRNSGAAFSMATGYTWVLTFVALAVVLGIVRYASKLVSTGWVIGLGLVLGGAIGNLTDRMFRSPGPLRGHVVDFIKVGDWWPTFNVADSAVVCGAILLVVLTLLGYDYDGTRTGWAARNLPADTDDEETTEDA
ncbi:hypothetical protein nbrc107696_37640 [Gordonia spumicola]|uniref:Lipoprotein signal peptidase n=2 Tax=Gordonia spumicola TaxID=589161 RepID=A0A7I9VD79_9ACTN|nr:hypothetical protein nbrc107696_37640 [Gordonia spumicola]